jgi:hypothetical protein
VIDGYGNLWSAGGAGTSSPGLLRANVGVTLVTFAFFLLQSRPSGNVLPVSLAVVLCWGFGAAPTANAQQAPTVELVDGRKVSSSASPVLTLSDVQGGDMGSYSAQASNQSGSAASTQATLHLTPLVAWGGGGGGNRDQCGPWAGSCNGHRPQVPSTTLLCVVTGPWRPGVAITAITAIRMYPLD